MILTDHFLSRSDLEGIAQRIASGQPVTYPQEAVDEYVKLFEENSDLNRRADWFIRGCFAIFVLMVIVAIATVVDFAT